MTEGRAPTEVAAQQGQFVVGTLEPYAFTSAVGAFDVAIDNDSCQDDALTERAWRNRSAL